MEIIKLVLKDRTMLYHGGHKTDIIESDKALSWRS